jgi:K(+)-stimulated pyrophosphate-energized sodium pump
MNILIKLMSIVSLVIAPHLNMHTPKKMSMTHPVQKEIRVQAMNRAFVKIDKKG